MNKFHTPLYPFYVLFIPDQTIYWALIKAMCLSPLAKESLQALVKKNYILLHCTKNSRFMYPWNVTWLNRILIDYKNLLSNLSLQCSTEAVAHERPAHTRVAYNSEESG